MLARCVLLEVPLQKLVEELGLEGPAGQLLSCMLYHFIKPFQLSLIIFKVKNTQHLAACPKDFTANVIFEQTKTTTIMGFKQDLG